MSRGGARNRSGPAPDPDSARSEQRKFLLSALPADGFPGPVPEFPIPMLGDDQELREREVDLWFDAWRTPQACAWSMEPWRWTILAEYCRLKAIVEAGAPAAYTGQLHRYRDQLGLTPAGMRDNGWAIATQATPTSDAEASAPIAEPSIQEKAAASGQFKVIPGGQKAG